jgi:hypothetical protein
MKSNNSIYSIIFICISCVLFIFFSVGIVLNPNGPQRQIFFRGMKDLFADFFNVLCFIGDRDPYFSTILSYEDKSYFPLTYLILYPFSKLDNFSTMTLEETWNSKIGLISVFLFTGFSVFLLFVALNRIIKKYSVSSIFLLSFIFSYIFFFSIERANILILTVAFVGFFICYYDSENKYERIFAAISLALAATLKIYPVLFGFLYFEKKQYREIFISAIITLLLVFLPYLFFYRGFANIPQQIINTSLHIKSYNYARFFPRFNLSHLVFRILSLLKLSVNIISSLAAIAQIIIYIATFFSILFSCLIKNKWIKISLLTMVLVFFPASSALYCGLYMFPMMIIFFATLKERTKKFNVFTIIVFIILLSPYQIVTEEGDSINYLLINIALLRLWYELLVYSGKQIMPFLKGLIQQYFWSSDKSRKILHILQFSKEVVHGLKFLNNFNKKIFLKRHIH